MVEPGYLILGSLTVGYTLGVLFPGKDAVEEEFREGLGTCLRGGGPVLPCISTGALHALETANSAPEFHLTEGMSLNRDSSVPVMDMPRGDPREARTFLDGIGMYMQQRSFQWDMSGLFPGLFLAVGPGSRGGVLEFQLDPRKVADDRSLSAGKLLMKRTLLPVLLGLKLNLAALTPLLFAALVIVTKKALLLSKLSFLISGASFLNNAAVPPYHHHIPYSPLHYHKPLSLFHDAPGHLGYRDTLVHDPDSTPFLDRGERTLA